MVRRDLNEAVTYHEEEVNAVFFDGRKDKILVKVKKKESKWCGTKKAAGHSAGQRAWDTLSKPSDTETCSGHCHCGWTRMRLKKWVLLAR